MHSVFAAYTRTCAILSILPTTSVPTFLLRHEQCMLCRLNIELLLLFCPSYSAETGVLLEYCDVPSLFSAIKF